MTYSITTIPAENDIVCGRGKGFDLLPANQIFRSIISENAERYSGFRRSRTEKSILIRLIAHQLKMDNMRFVKRTKQGWKALPDHEVNLKVRSKRNEQAIYFMSAKRPITFQIGHALRDVAPLQQKSQKRACTRNPLENERKASFRREMRHTRVVSFSSVGEASFAFPSKVGLPYQSDVDSIIDVSLFDHFSPVATATRDQDRLACVAKHTQRCNLSSDRDEISNFQNDVLHGRLQLNIIDDVVEPSFLSVPMADIYQDFVNDKGDEYLDIQSHDTRFQV